MPSGEAVDSHLSKSARAACLRPSASLRASASSLVTASQRGRSCGTGMRMTGGVFGMLPSIAACVVLLK